MGENKKENVRAQAQHAHTQCAALACVYSDIAYSNKNKNRIKSKRKIVTRTCAAPFKGHSQSIYLTVNVFSIRSYLEDDEKKSHTRRTNQNQSEKRKRNEM